jgi:hypothetical protein
MMRMTVGVEGVVLVDGVEEASAELLTAAAKFVVAVLGREDGVAVVPGLGVAEDVVRDEAGALGVEAACGAYGEDGGFGLLLDDVLVEVVLSPGVLVDEAGVGVVAAWNEEGGVVLVKLDGFLDGGGGVGVLLGEHVVFDEEGVVAGGGCAADAEGVDGGVGVGAAPWEDDLLAVPDVLVGELGEEFREEVLEEDVGLGDELQQTEEAHRVGLGVGGDGAAVPAVLAADDALGEAVEDLADGADGGLEVGLGELYQLALDGVVLVEEGEGEVSAAVEVGEAEDAFGEEEEPSRGDDARAHLVEEFEGTVPVGAGRVK